MSEVFFNSKAVACRFPLPNSARLMARSQPINRVAILARAGSKGMTLGLASNTRDARTGYVEKAVRGCIVLRPVQ